MLKLPSSSYSWDAPKTEVSCKYLDLPSDFPSDWDSELLQLLRDVAVATPSSRRATAKITPPSLPPFPRTFPPEIIIEIVALGGALRTPSRSSSLGAAGPRTTPSHERAFLRSASLVCKSWTSIAQRELFRHSYLYDEIAIPSYLAAVPAWRDAVEVVELRGESYGSKALDALLEALPHLEGLVFDGFTPWCDPMIYPHSFRWTTKGTYIRSLTIHHPSRTLLETIKTSPPGAFPSLHTLTLSHAPEALAPLLAIVPPLASLTIISWIRIDYKILAAGLTRHRETLRRLELRTAKEEGDEAALEEIARACCGGVEILKMDI